MIVTGSDKPDVYIISPGLKGKESKLIGRNEEDDILLEALMRADVRNYRFCSILSTPTYGTITAEDLVEKKDKVISDIRKRKPKVIVALGQVTASIFMDSGKPVGKLASGNHEFEGIPVRVIYHPTYILKRGGIHKPAFDEYVSHWNIAVNSKTESGLEYQIDWSLVNTPEKWSKAKRHLEKFDELAYDTETNAEPKYSAQNRIIGMSISSPEKAFYITAKAFGGQKDFTPAVDLLLSRKQVLVYNAPFEHGVLHSTHNGVVFENFFDVAMLARVRCIVTSLKNLARRELGITNWADTVKEFDDFIELVLTHLRVKASGNLKKFLDVLRDEGWDEFFEAIENTRTGPDIREMFEEIRNQISEKAVERLRRKICQQALEGYKPVYYDLIPVSIVGKYCCIDAHSLFKLRDTMLEKMDKREKESIPYYHQQTLLACELERNSVRWDDEKATQIDDTYSGLMLMSLKGLILSDRVRDALGLSEYEIEEVLTCTDITYLQKQYLNPNSSAKTSESLRVLNEAIRTDNLKIATSIHEMNSAPEEFPSFDKYYSKHKDPEIARSISREAKVKHKALLRESKDGKVKSLDEIRADMIQEYQNHQVTRFFTFAKKNYPLRTKLDSDTFWLLDEIMKEPTVSLADEPVSAMMNALPYMGIKITNPESWEDYPEVTPLLFLRFFKKVKKGKSTYIDGKKVGRGQVWVVKQRKDGSFIRKKRYEPGEAIYLFQTDFFSNSAETKRWRSGFHTVPAACELRDIQVSRYPFGMVTHCDYSQAEIRTMAYLAGCTALLEQFQDENVDVHRVIASKMLKKPPDAITKAERRYAKTGTFSILYGATPFRLAMMNMKGDVDAAERMFQEFYDAFPEIKEWIDKTHLMLLRKGYVRTIFGDKLFVPIPVRLNSREEVDELPRETAALVRRALRQGQNWPIQGASSGLAAWGSWNSVMEMRRLGLRSKSFNFQHDSQDNDVHGEDVFLALHASKRKMEELPLQVFGIPMKLDLEMGVRNNSSGGVSKLQIDKKGKHVEFDFSIRKDWLDEIMLHLEKHWRVVTMDLKSEEQDHTPFEELFLARRAFSWDIGKTFTKQKFHMELKTRR